MTNKKIKYVFDRDMRSWTRLDLNKDEYGFSGQYIHKDYGICDIYLSQDSKESYYLILNVWISGREYERIIEIEEKCSYRFAGLQARKFLEELKGEKE